VNWGRWWRLSQGTVGKLVVAPWRPAAVLGRGNCGETGFGTSEIGGGARLGGAPAAVTSVSWRGRRRLTGVRWHI
jgi:hypothetical protein